MCAAYLARAGQSVCVLERRHVLGGCATTEELWPGYKVSTAAYVISLFLPQIIRELKLKEYGLTILPRSPSSFTPLPDGRSLLMGADPALCHREIAKFSMRRCGRVSALQRVSGARGGGARTGAQPGGARSAAAARRVAAHRLGKKLRDGKKLWGLYRALGELGADLPQAVELLTGAARPILDRWFESDVLKATLATDAIIGAFLSISSPGSAYVLLHHVMGEAGGARGVWGYVQGRHGRAGGVAGRRVPRSAASRFAASRRCARSSPTAAGRSACGSKTARRSTRSSWPRASTPISRSRSFSRRRAARVLPRGGGADRLLRRPRRRSTSRSPSRRGSRACRRDGVGPHHHGTMHIGPSLDYLERAYDDAKYGRPSERPILEMTMATSVDHTIAPPGKHILSMFVQYAPYKLAEGQLGRHQGSVRRPLHRGARRVRAECARRDRASAGALAARSGATFGITGGNIMQGAMSAHQLFCFRPVAGWADHRTPIRGLYLCGAASHPGGGVLGACGKNAAEEILRDL